MVWPDVLDVIARSLPRCLHVQHRSPVRGVSSTFTERPCQSRDSEDYGYRHLPEAQCAGETQARPEVRPAPGKEGLR